MSDKFLGSGGFYIDENGILRARGFRTDKHGNMGTNFPEVLLEDRTLRARELLSVNLDVLGRGLWVGFRLSEAADIQLMIYPRGGGTNLGGPTPHVIFFDSENIDRGGDLAPEEYLSAEIRLDIYNRSYHDVELRMLAATHKF